MREPVGDFYVHLVTGSPSGISVDRDMTSSTGLLSRTGKPTVIHFYDGGWGGCRPCAAQMQKWAATIPSVQFACVCVESAQVAAAFHRMFRFDEAPLLVNCYIPSRNYMPVGYGQLGCSGFVVSDAKGNFVSRKTMAYLQHGERAFGFVESLLEDLVPDLYGVNDHCNYSNQHSNINGNGNGNSNDSDNNNDNDSNNNNSNKQKRKTATKATTATTTSATTATRTTIKPPESVGVDAMDEEHRICTDSFNRAAKDPTVETLEELHDILKSHFDHEEELISKHTSSKGSFSSLDSHRMDHQRILRIAAAELGRVAAAATTSSCTTLPDACGMTQGGRKEWHKPAVAQPPSSNAKANANANVDIEVIRKLAEAFHLHAENFDSLYHAQIPADAE